MEAGDVTEGTGITWMLWVQASELRRQHAQRRIGAKIPHRANSREETQMLVLSRQRDESIIIGDNIVVTIVDIRGDKVRLGINAPTEIPVHRQEVYEAIQRENLRATRIEPNDTRDLGKVMRGPARPNGEA